MDTARHEVTFRGTPVQSVTVETEQIEIGDWFAGAALAILGLAGVGSLAWFGRLP